MNSLYQAIEKGLSIKDKIISNINEELNYQQNQGRPHQDQGRHYQQQQERNFQQNHYPGQNYASLKNECLSSRSLFSDVEFPAKGNNLLPRDTARHIEWKRPREICRNPRFFVDGASRFDLTQGELGDCWLIATIANLTLNKELFNQVIPAGQEFDGGYAGIFYFRFWCFGQWQEIVVDDKLPTYNGKLIYVKSQDRNEFWPSLLEKAYAKLQGSYRALDGGITSDAMVHFTGGVTEMIDLKNCHSNLFEIMNKGMERGSLLAGSISGSRKEKEQRLSNGLVRGHAYSITNVCWCNTINRPGHPVKLIRMRNPWGNEVEWRGSWSDGSKEWSYVSAEEKRVLKIQFKKDGEFWMCFEDFRRHFEYLEMTNVNLESLKEHDSGGRLQHMWKVEKFQGAWVKGVSAGGCSNYSNSFPENPKFIITLTEADDGNNDGQCTMIVALLQRPKGSKHLGARASHPIGFSLFRISSTVDHNNMNKKFFKKTEEMHGLDECIVSSQVSHRYNLPVGKYCLIPTTMYPGEEADFILRIFTEKAPQILNKFTNFSFEPAFNLLQSGTPQLDQASAPLIPPYISANPATAPYPVQPVENSLRAPYPVMPPFPLPSTAQDPGTSPYPLPPTAQYPGTSPYPLPSATQYPGPSPYPPPVVNNPAFTPYPQSAVNNSAFTPYPMATAVNNSEHSSPSFSQTITTPAYSAYPPPSGINNQNPTAYPLPPTVNNTSFAPYPPQPTVQTQPYFPNNPNSGFGASNTTPYPDGQTTQSSIPLPYPSHNPLWTNQIPPAIEPEESRTINWKKLRNILDSTFASEFVFDGFSKAACRSMIALMDDDNSGQLDDREMSKLLTAIDVGKVSFLKHDIDGSGVIDSYKFRAALKSTGICITDLTLKSLMTAYGDDGFITFEDYILCQLKLNRALRSFLNKDISGVGFASFTQEEYFKNCL